MHEESLKLVTHASGTIVVVLKLLSSIYYFVRQSLLLQGHD